MIAAGATNGAVLDKYIGDTGGTRHVGGTSAATADGYKIVATNTATSETYTYKDGSAAVADGVAGAAENYEFKDADGNVAFTVTAVNGTTNVTAANKLTALGAIKFTAADGEFKYESTFGNTTSKIEVAKTANDGLTFQVGANEGDSLTINVDRMDTEYLGISGASIYTRETASKALTSVDKAIKMVSAQRASLGAIQNRLDYKIDNLNTSSENLTSAESQIRDVDMAKEMTEFTNASILQQASISMLAQANSQPQSVLSSSADRAA
jgi:flagellin